MTKISRSTKLRLKYSNKNKIDYFKYLFNDVVLNSCKDLTNHLLYQDEEPQKLVRSDVIKEFLPIHGRLGQVLANQCSSLARSIRNKVKNIKDGSNTTKYQDEIIAKLQSKTLEIGSISLFDLDSRFVSIEESYTKEFDYWIVVHFPKCETIKIPFYETKHMKLLKERGFELKCDYMRIHRNGEIQLVFKKEVDFKIDGDTIGIDIGRNKAFNTSREETENFTKDILNSLKRQKHGSKNKASRVRRLKQLIDSLIKQNIEWETIKTIVMEQLTDMKQGKRWGNINHHWSYRYIQNRIRLTSEEHGVRVQEVHPAYTSQTCSKCGHKHKDNRQGEKFLCLSCGNEMDADLNAAINIRKRGIDRIHGPKRVSI